MTPEEIRALYVETLARAGYLEWCHYRAEDSAGEDCTDPDWRQRFVDRATSSVEALAAAGLLPTSAVDSLAGGCQLGVHDPFGDCPPTVLLRHYVTDPRPAKNTPEAWAAWQAVQDDWNRRVLGIEVNE